MSASLINWYCGFIFSHSRPHPFFQPPLFLRTPIILDKRTGRKDASFGSLQLSMRFLLDQYRGGAISKITAFDFVTFQNESKILVIGYIM